MTTLNTTLNKFFDEHYKEIVHIARRITKTSDKHVYQDLAHHAMEAFVIHPRAEELIEKKHATVGLLYTTDSADAHLRIGSWVHRIIKKKILIHKLYLQAYPPN